MVLLQLQELSSPGKLCSLHKYFSRHIKSRKQIVKKITEIVLLDCRCLHFNLEIKDIVPCNTQN